MLVFVLAVADRRRGVRRTTVGAQAPGSTRGGSGARDRLGFGRPPHDAVEGCADERTEHRPEDVDPEVGPLPGHESGAERRAGFIDAPVTGPATSAPRATAPPMAIAAAEPLTCAPDTCPIA